MSTSGLFVALGVERFAWACRYWRKHHSEEVELPGAKHSDNS